MPRCATGTLTRGRFITAEDNDNLGMVVVLGQTAVEDLFGSTQVNPIGETIRINRQNYEVIGVLKAKGQSGPSNQDDVIFMPLRTAQLKLGGAGTTTVRTINLRCPLRRRDGPGPGTGDGHSAHAARPGRPARRTTSPSRTRRTS